MQPTLLLHGLLRLSLFCLPFSARAQESDITLTIKSEQKQLFRESGMLKETADDVYRAKLDPLKRAVADWLRSEVKSISRGQTMHSDQVNLTVGSSIELVSLDNRIFIRYALRGNSIKFRVTTPEVLGVGVGKFADPDVWMTFDALADFELKQDGTAESIRLMNPDWQFKTTAYSGNNLGGSFDKAEVSIIGYLLPGKLLSVYASLNDMNDQLNNYLQKVIKQNPLLLKELAIDDNKQVQVVADFSNGTLIFQHRYSPAGIVKRTATTNASGVTDGTAATGARPLSTSASGINKKNNVLNTPAVSKPAIRKN